MEQERSFYSDFVESIQRELYIYQIQHGGARPVKIFMNTPMLTYVQYGLYHLFMDENINKCKTLFGIPVQEYESDSKDAEYYFAETKGNLWLFNEREPIEVPVMIKNEECEYLK